MGSRDETLRLFKEATASLKSDLRSAIEKYERAYALSLEGGATDDAAAVAEELARAHARKKTFSRALYFAREATELAPDDKAAWTTLAKTCELVAARLSGSASARAKTTRTRALYRAAAASFTKASSLSKDAEDRRWLAELAADARKQGGPAPKR